MITLVDPGDRCFGFVQPKWGWQGAQTGGTENVESRPLSRRKTMASSLPPRKGAPGDFRITLYPSFKRSGDPFQSLRL
jgi:hypothetical protein